MMLFFGRCLRGFTECIIFAAVPNWWNAKIDMWKVKLEWSSTPSLTKMSTNPELNPGGLKVD